MGVSSEEFGDKSRTFWMFQDINNEEESCDAMNPQKKVALMRYAIFLNFQLWIKKWKILEHLANLKGRILVHPKKKVYSHIKSASSPSNVLLWLPQLNHRLSCECTTYLLNSSPHQTWTWALDSEGGGGGPSFSIFRQIPRSRYDNDQLNLMTSSTTTADICTAGVEVII